MLATNKQRQVVFDHLPGLPTSIEFAYTDLSKPVTAKVTTPVQGLSESQKICLRLVARGLTSKEIAIENGWSPQTVDTYLKSAMARLGATNRREAARQFVEQERFQSLGSPSRPVAEQPVIVEPEVAVPERGWRQLLAPPPLGGTANELSAVERSLAIFKVAAMSAAGLIALTLVIAGVLQTFR